MNKTKIILGIETSCDETAAAVLQKTGNRVTILSNVVASSAALQAKYGGVIPEQAAREQIKSIIPVIHEALIQSNLYPPSSKNHLLPSIIDRPAIDAIAVTEGPGLIGSLLVGVETAKTLALVWNKPLIPVNHLLGHFYANWITPAYLRGKTENLPRSHLGGVSMPAFPCIGLLVSGGHTDLLLFKDHGKYKYLGGTRDDAAGECFDKCARLLGLPYPGGPAIARLAESAKRAKLASKVFDPEAQTRRGDARLVFDSSKRALRIDLPRPMIDSGDFDFSFSGLKTAVANLLTKHKKTAKSRARKNVVQLSGPQNLRISRPSLGAKQIPSERSGRANVFFSRDELANLAASIEQAIVDVLVAKTIRAAQTFKVDQTMIAGGVAANQKLIRNFKFQISNFKLKAKLFVPPPQLCTDNAAMIASAAFFNYRPIDPLTLQASPSLNLSDLTISH